MEQSRKQNDEIEINLGEIFRALLSKAGLIVISGLLVMALAFGYTKLMVVPQYESMTTMYILAQEDENSLTSSDMETSEYIAKDYQTVIQGRTVLEAVIEKEKLDMSYEELGRHLTVESEEGTRIIAIKVKADSPEKARRIANAIRNDAIKHIENVMKIDTASIVDKANLPDKPCSPNLTKNMVLGAILGVLLAAVFVVIRYLVNDTIKTPEDIEKYLEISNLGSIPVSKNGENQDRKSVKRSFRKMKRG